VRNVLLAASRRTERALLRIDHGRLNVPEEPLRQAALPLQRGQMRSPAQALLKELRQLRQSRLRSWISPVSVEGCFLMHIIWACDPAHDSRHHGRPAMHLGPLVRPPLSG